MRTFPDVRICTLIAGLRNATTLIEKGDHVEALKVLLDVRARAAKVGVESAFLVWNLAVCEEALGEFEAAFETISEAARLDPLAQPIQATFDSIAWRMRQAVADPERAPEDPAIARMYDALMSAGECDVSSHVAMARHLSAVGEHERAMKILDAVTLLASVSRDAWRAKAAVARAMGDEGLVTECETQAATIAEQEVPYGMGPAAVRC